MELVGIEREALLDIFSSAEKLIEQLGKVGKFFLLALDALVELAFEVLQRVDIFIGLKELLGFFLGRNEGSTAVADFHDFQIYQHIDSLAGCLRGDIEVAG